MSLFSRTLRFTATNVPRILKAQNIYAACPIRGFSAPKVQSEAPDFKGTAVVDQDFKEIKLADYKGKYLVFYFYPLDFTFVCPTEIIAFSEMYDEFKKIDTEIVACSTDSHYSHLAWKNTPRKAGGIGDIKYPLLSDFTKEIAKSYNVLIESSGIALRGLYVIDGKGIIRHMSVNDLPVGRSVEEILRIVKAFQFNDKYGEGIQFSLRNPSYYEERKHALINPQPEKPSLIDPKLGISLIDSEPKKPSLKKPSKSKFMGKVKEIISGNKPEVKK